MEVLEERKAPAGLNPIMSIYVIALLYFFVNVFVFLGSRSYIPVIMVWNVFLAALPLVFARGVHKVVEKPEGVKSKRFKAVLLSLLWFFFFPNAPYLVTDFIHIRGERFFSDFSEVPLIQEQNPLMSYPPQSYPSTPSAENAAYPADLLAWLKLTDIGLGVFLGTMAGLASLYILHRLLLKRKKVLLAHGLVAVNCLISGYAIYIGRFLRYNSWDVLKPVKLLNSLMSNINLFTLQFSLLFAGYIFAAYWIFYAFMNSSEKIE